MPDLHLHPCPFCGGAAQPYDDRNGHYLIQCHACLAEGPFKDSIEEAAEAWNGAHAQVFTRLKGRVLEVVSSAIPPEWTHAQYEVFAPLLAALERMEP